MTVVRVRGTEDAAEIAAVLAAVAARGPAGPADEPTPYERWRRTRTAALRASRSR